ncbi:unnamed protein product [Phytophthora fragariaefolia]|uniref:Unnamed protein product n=1 Tax=Phytophthora fragariaefolia TaxID=1490495 RepID=A0A9W6YDN1_9STRA|nr:unnamed protein product [Phytophthora fragariaefolia]
MILPILTSGQHVLEGGDLSFQHDALPVASSSDRHASKLIRKRLKKRKQGYAVAVKTSIYGHYPASRASSQTESRFGGSRFGGSRASGSLWGTISPPKVSRMSLIYGLNNGSESFMSSSWMGSQQGSSGAVSNYTSWLPEGFSNAKDSSPPPSLSGTARVAVDFAEQQRRADIERDLNTRESIRRSKDEINRKSDLRLKLRSLNDPMVSLEREEATMAALVAKGSRSRIQRSRLEDRTKRLELKQPGVPSFNNGKCATSINDTKSFALVVDETATFRTKDYEGLSSDVVLFSNDGKLLIGQNCFVVEQRHREELLLDLQTRGIVQPRIQLVATPKQEEKRISNENLRGTGIDQVHSSPPPQLSSTTAKQTQVLGTTNFDGQLGSFESSPGLALDLDATSLVKGVALKLPGSVSTLGVATKTRNAPTKLSRPKQHAVIPESASNANIETHLSTLIRARGANKPVLGISRSDSVLQTEISLLSAASLSTVSHTGQPPQTAKVSGASSPVLPKHIVSIFESKLQQSLW